jgi:flagellar hook protein FlgE
VVTGSFSNGLTRTLGQLAAANFANPQGFDFRQQQPVQGGAELGQSVITAPQTLAAGRVVSGALERGNVDITREIIGLISASTGFSAAGRVMTTSDDLLNQLMSLAR